MRLLVPAFLATLLLASPTQAQTPIRQEVDALLTSMVAAFKADPASVSTFYADDASILGGGQRAIGREQIDQYWKSASMFADWKLEVLEVGEGASPWVRGRSTVVGKSGSQMTTEFIGLLKRQSDGRLKFYVDMYVAAGPTRR